MQENSRCWLCGNSDAMINHIISECSKLAEKEYKTTQLGGQGNSQGIVQKD